MGHILYLITGYRLKEINHYLIIGRIYQTVKVDKKKSC